MKKSSVKKEVSLYVDILGWYGVVAIFFAYALLSFNFLEATGLSYQILNMTGALGIMIEAYSKRDYQPVTLNIIWFVIALIAILRILFW